MRVLILLLALMPSLASAAIEVTVPESWNLYRGSTIEGRGFATKAACQAAAPLELARRCVGSETFVRRQDVQPPPPPPPPPPPTPTGAYDVGARIAAFNARVTELRGSSPFAALALPAAPTITRQITVATAAEMQAAQGMAGAEIRFTGAGFTGTLRPGADQRWVFPAGFTLTAPAEGYALDVSAARRVELVGASGARVVGAITGNGTQDLRIRGLDVRSRTNSPQIWYDMHAINNCSRVLIEDSYLFARSYAMIYSDCTHFVVANSEVVSAGDHATARAARGDFVLWMDSRLATQGNQQNFRAHESTGRFAGFNLQIEGGTGSYFGPAGTTLPTVDDLLMIDNAYYGQGDTIAITDNRVRTGIFVGNRGYSPWGAGSQIPLSAPVGALVRDNPRLPYQAPPAWARR